MISSISGTSSLTSMLQIRQNMFSKIDTNGDGKHDASELAQMVANGPTGGATVEDILSQFDSDGDGAISEAEFNAANPDQTTTETTQAMSTSDFIAQMFTQFDTNSDGTIDSSELEQVAAMGPEDGSSASELLSQLDTDGNGSISETEFANGPWANNGTQGPPPPPPPSQAQDSSQTSETQDSSETDSLFSYLDTDGDGSISQTEFDTVMSQMMTALSAYQSTSTSYIDNLAQSMLSSALYA